MPVQGSIALELEPAVVCTHGQPWVVSTIAECHHMVHSYVLQSQVDHRNLAGYGVAANSCELPSCGSHLIFPCSMGS